MKRNRSSSPIPNLNNISTMKIKNIEEEISDDVFSESNIPSFSSDEDIKPKFKKKKRKDTSGDKTISTQPFTHEKNCVMFSSIDGNSLKTNSKSNLRISEHFKISSFNNKLMDGLSNKTCSCLTMKSKSSMFGTDSHFPSSYNDINSLSENQIQEIIRHKMKLLDKYNEKILKRKNTVQYKYVLVNYF